MAGMKLPRKIRNRFRLPATKAAPIKVRSSQTSRQSEEKVAAVELFAFQLKAAKIEYRREWEFAREELGRGWRWDFDFRPWLLAVEINGGVWMKGGAHALPTNILRDYEKGNAAALLGWRTLAFTPNQVRDGSALALTEKCLARMKFLYANGGG